MNMTPRDYRLQHLQLHPGEKVKVKKKKKTKKDSE
jgi:hypothetical protein